MSTLLKNTMIASCLCGQVKLEAVGAPISSVVCYCDDCQEGSRQIEAIPDAGTVQDPDGGTAYLVYRKDRLGCVTGSQFLKNLKIRKTSTTNRVIATCCNSAMFLNFDDGKHWVDVYRSRCKGNLPPMQMRICTKFKPDSIKISDEVPSYSGYPFKFLLMLLAARIAMLFHR
ncbi:MAG: hypothetical protein HY254_11425 [Burkholderiales bacterium]|nr:hypothetical protein [Burkholderiales bacterium]